MEVTGDVRAAESGDWRAFLAGPVPRPAPHIHLLGIGGSGLSAIAEVLLQRGFTVSGSDRDPGPVCAELEQHGATVYRGHAAANIHGASLVLVSSAVSPENPEIAAARAAGIPVVKRSEFLAPLMAGSHGIGVAGTHGKSTTTGMIATLLWRAGLDPSFIIGGRLSAAGAGAGVAARAGTGAFVIEADEYDRMFLGLRLRTAVVTYVEWDHVDCYPTPESFTAAFREFAGRIPASGHLILCADEPGAAALYDAAGPDVRVSTYGMVQPAKWSVRDVAANDDGGMDGTVLHGGHPWAELRLRVPGRHNVLNALAAIAVGDECGVAPEAAVEALWHFHGVGRRFEITGERGGVTVVDDYGHHPTEIAATLAAARVRFPGRRLWAVFQPHTYSRLQALQTSFAASLDGADHVLVLDVYAAREEGDPAAFSRNFVAAMDHPRAEYAGDLDTAVARLQEAVAPGDVVITLSAGDGNQVGARLLAALHTKAAQ